MFTTSIKIRPSVDPLEDMNALAKDIDGLFVDVHANEQAVEVVVQTADLAEVVAIMKKEGWL